MTGSFVRHDFIDQLIRKEKKNNPNCRQVVAILLLCPAGHSICLTVSERALMDRRPHVSPPQGGIGETPSTQYESLISAAAREVREEVKADLWGKVIYLGSTRRKLDESHPKFPVYDSQHYHWVTARSVGWNLTPQSPTAEANWAHHDSIESSMQLCMSEEKRRMFGLAYREMIRLSTNRQIIRPEELQQRMSQTAQVA